jgi:hypothetical protein
MRVMTESEPARGVGSATSLASQTRPTAWWRHERVLEVVTAVLLGTVAVVTAWSGYQATRWSGEQSARYAEASALRVQAAEDVTVIRELRLYDLIMVNAWLEANARGDVELADMYERRFRPQFAEPFHAWLALDPFHDPAAPPGPLFMPGYAQSLGSQADVLEAEAERAFAAGRAANEHGDAYVLATVAFATVLFLTAIAERFVWPTIRAIVLSTAIVLLLFGVYQLAALPIT